MPSCGCFGSVWTDDLILACKPRAQESLLLLMLALRVSRLVFDGDAIGGKVAVPDAILEGIVFVVVSKFLDRNRMH